jgi:hypothetical protein
MIMYNTRTAGDYWGRIDFPFRVTWDYFPRLNYSTRALATWDPPQQFWSMHVGAGVQRRSVSQNESVAFTSGAIDVARFRTLAFKMGWPDSRLGVTHTGDGLVYTGGSTALTSMQEFNGETYSGVSGGTSFSGGLYVGQSTPTCGGNANGAACYPNLYVPNIFRPDDNNYRNWRMCHLSDGDPRRWCWTDNTYTAWGYCDCDDYSGATRWFDVDPSREKHVHNSAGRGGNVVVISDEIHSPVTSTIEWADLGRPGGFHKFYSTPGLCFRSQHYRTPVAYENVGREGSIVLVNCPDGEALTGVAMTDNTSQWLFPRCGVPAGWTVLPASQGTTISGLYDTTITHGMQNVACAEGNVTVGLNILTARGTNVRGSRVMRLTCAPYTITDPLPSEYTRSCTTVNCTNELSLTSTTSLEACMLLCNATPLCFAAELVTEASHLSCRMFNGSCPDSSEPYGRSAGASHSYVQPALFTPVEYEHPVHSSELQSFVVASVPGDVFLRRDAFGWQGTPWTTCTQPCGTGSQTRTVFCGPHRLPTLEHAIDDSYCDATLRLPDTQ